MATKFSRSHTPLETTLSYLSDSWRFLIVYHLMHNTMRFGELQKAIGTISQKVLTNNLRAMEEDGLLTRTVFPEIPPRVEYALTPKGQSLARVIDAMNAWGKKNMN